MSYSRNLSVSNSTAIRSSCLRSNKPNSRATRPTWTSKGIISRFSGILRHTPKSTLPSLRTSQRNIKCIRLHADFPLWLLVLRPGSDKCLLVLPSFPSTISALKNAIPFHGSSSRANTSSIVSCMVYTHFKPRHIYCKSRPKNVRWMFMSGLRHSHSPFITYSNGLPCMMPNNILWHPCNICFRLPHAIVDARNAAISMSWMSVNIRGNFTGSLSTNCGTLYCVARASNLCFKYSIVAMLCPPPGTGQGGGRWFILQKLLYPGQSP